MTDEPYREFNGLNDYIYVAPIGREVYSEIMEAEVMQIETSLTYKIAWDAGFISGLLTGIGMVLVIVAAHHFFS